MLLGYARVSKKEDQDIAAQVDALNAAGCERIFYENASGGRWDRPELHALLDQLRPDDVFLVWKLDRLSRSLKDLIAILEKIEKAGAKFQSLTEHIETVSPAGRMLVHMLGSFAEFERAMIRERTRRGLEYARSQGRHGGRKPKLSPAQQATILQLVETGGKSGAEAGRLFKVSKATVSRLLSKEVFKKAGIC
jgi:DNA invertase Pin-like site-specific DNA recombinase